jgi:hypothetical protein
VAGCCECSDEPSGSWATELVSLCINTMPLPIYTERHHCYSKPKEVVPVGTHLNFYYIHESLVPFFFYFY